MKKDEPAEPQLQGRPGIEGRDASPTPDFVTLPPEQQEEQESPAPRGPRWLRIGKKVLTFTFAFFMFVLAIQLMKSGAGSLSVHLDVIRWNALSTLGLGTLLAYLFLSGKPVTAFALALFTTGGLTRLQTFTMISGGRLGAAFIVLLVGFLYVMRGRDRRTALGIGILSLCLTASVYIPGMLVGYGLLRSGSLDHLRLTSAGFQSFIGYVYDPIVAGFENVLSALHLPDAFLLPLGGAIIVGAIKFLDRLLPEVEARHIEEHHGRTRSMWAMFFTGFFITLVTLSVSVALTVLVPLTAKGHIGRDRAIPYIMGANVSTMIDNLVISVAYGKAVGVQLVLAEFIGISVITLIYLVFLYRPLAKAMISIDDWVVGSNKRVGVFVTLLFVLPLLLILLGFVIGPNAKG